ncbi:MAG: hypothetical protein PVG90_00090 [Bacillota bacterium]|jgi:hypothetical protein
MKEEKFVNSQPNVAAPVEEYNDTISFSLHVPMSLYQSLDEEAQAKGVTLEALILSKISKPLYDILALMESNINKE